MTVFYFILVAGGIAGYAAIAITGIPPQYSLWWLVLGGLLTYPFLPLVLVAIWFVLSRMWRSKMPAGPLPLGTYVRMLAQELATVAISWPVMALHTVFIRDPAPAPAKLPILLVHGVFNNDGVWFLFRKFLSQQKIAPVYTLNFDPPLGDIEDFADQLAKKIDDILSATGADRVTLICHSMGGLIARAYIRRHGSKRIDRLVTLGTPHHGSRLAGVVPGRCLAQMRPGNDWLSELNGTDRGLRALITSIWSRDDTMVLPQASSELAGAENIALIGIGHNALLTDASIQGAVLRLINGEKSELARGSTCD